MIALRTCRISVAQFSSPTSSVAAAVLESSSTMLAADKVAPTIRIATATEVVVTDHSAPGRQVGHDAWIGRTDLQHRTRRHCFQALGDCQQRPVAAAEVTGV